MIAAGLLARNAIAKGLRAKPWVKTSFSPGSRVVPAMLAKAGLSAALDALGFHLVGFGCMTCGSGSGTLAEEVAAEIAARELVAVGVISGNRNFDGRLNASVRGTFLASPPLVVAYAIAGSILHDLTRDKLGDGADGESVFLADIWPADTEIRACLDSALTRDLFVDAYGRLRRARKGMVLHAQHGAASFRGIPKSIGISCAGRPSSTSQGTRRRRSSARAASS